MHSLRTRLVLAAVSALVAAACGSEVETTPDDGTGGSEGSPGPSTSAANGPAGTQASSSAGEGGNDDVSSVGHGGSSDVSVGAGGAGGAACDAPLDQATLEALELTRSNGSALGSMTAQPGEVVQLQIGYWGIDSFEPVAACATFSVESGPADVDPDTGVLTVRPDAPDDSLVHVFADVEEGRREIEAWLYIWTEEGNPVVGFYTEVAQLDCEVGDAFIPEQLIGELRLGADHLFGVTWQPFETYVDYWGSYTVDPETGAIELTADGGNYIPDDIDGSGTFSFEDGQLVLHDIWLGAPQGVEAEPQCGHVFE